MKKACLAALVAACLVPVARASGPISTAVFAPSPDALAFQRIHDAGAAFARINVSWAQIAPVARPAGFSAADPADSAYHWGAVDTQVEGAVNAGLTPYLTVLDAPVWAQKDEPHPTHLGPYPIGSWKPDPAQFELFARALALRYDGSAGVPRVRYFEVWDEPNLSQYLSPQIEGGTYVAAVTYRDLVNAFARAVHDVHEDNMVIAGSLSAFSFVTPFGRLGIAPLVFARRMLCMSADRVPRPTCATKVDFDAFSIHPWTSGGPTHHASEKDDVSLGDLPKLRSLIAAALRAGHVAPNHIPELWITEFAWDTRPPDTHPETTPLALQARWVAEALHQAWKNNVRVFTWLLLWDQLYPWQSLQSGLFFRNGEDLSDARPKPTFYAFRFPFVAYRAGSRISVWGRTPQGKPARVAIQQRTPSRWRFVGTLRANKDGILAGSVRYRKQQRGAFKPATRPSSAAQTYRDQVVSSKPVSYWPLNERDGSQASDSMHVNDGDYTDSVRLGVKGPLPGTRAASFNGKDARVRLGVVSSLHTVELWVKTRTKADAVAFSNRNRIHQFTAVGTYGGLVHSFDDYGIIGDAVGNGSWHHLAYTYDSSTSTGRLYVDGKLSQLAVYPRAEGGAAASIGYDADLQSYFTGSVAQVAVYSYVLSPDQIRSHYVASGRRVAPSAETGSLRAVDLSTGMASLPFSLHRPRDRYVLPFGGGGIP